MRSTGILGIMMIAIIMTSYGVDALTRCDECQIALGLAERYLENNTTETAIETYACDVFPSGYQKSCLAFLDIQLPRAISYLENKYPPKDVCEELGLCANSTDLIKMKPLLWKIRPSHQAVRL